jgi:hypothetical protein
MGCESPDNLTGAIMIVAGEMDVYLTAKILNAVQEFILDAKDDGKMRGDAMRSLRWLSDSYEADADLWEKRSEQVTP